LKTIIRQQILVLNDSEFGDKLVTI
jgi:hypothetical protein